MVIVEVVIMEVVVTMEVVAHTMLRVCACVQEEQVHQLQLHLAHV